MVGSYTAFEVEAERRREVLEDSMRDARRVLRQERRTAETTRGGQRREDGGLTALTAGLRARVGQRV
jgi:hypothetical protein